MNDGSDRSATGVERNAPSTERSDAWRDLLVAVLLRLISLLPLRIAHGIGWLVGHAMIRIPNKQRRNALINIRLCHPELTEEQARAFRDRSFIAYGKTYAEIAYLWQRPVARVLGLVRGATGLDLLERREGEGLIVLSPHLGAWELAGLYLSTLGPTTTLYRAQPVGDRLVRRARGRGGAQLVPTDQHGIRRLLQTLRQGGYVGILPDQQPKAARGSVFAPFFAVPALTMLLVSRLARKTGSRVVFLFAERLPKAKGFHLHCIPAPEGIAAGDDVTAATALNLGVERCIRVCPEQYVWAYKRFRSRPDGSPHPYRGPL
jgi:KDO2-lipid IV(A) lauroyltransferase